MKREMRVALSALLAFTVLGLSACGSSEQAQDPAASTAPQPAGTQEPAPAQPAGQGAGVREDPARQPSERQGEASSKAHDGKGKGGANKAGPRPIDTVRLAARKTTEAKTAKFTMLVGISGNTAQGPDSLSVRVDGAVNFDENVSRYTMNMPMIGQMKVRQIGPDVYLKMPRYARSQLPFEEAWVRWSTNDDSGAGAGDQTSQARTGTPDDVVDELDYLRSVSDSVDEVGRDWVRGVATTHYRAEIDLQTAARKGSPQVREAFRTMREDLGTETLPVEAWLDDEGRVRRFKMDVSLDGPELRDAGVDGARLTLTEEVYDYGAPVRVEAPPEDDTVDADEISERERARAA